MCRGFTKFARDDYLQWKKEGRLVNDGVNAKVRAAVVVTPGVMTSCLLQGAAGASGMSPATRPAEQEHVGKNTLSGHGMSLSLAAVALRQVEEAGCRNKCSLQKPRWG